MFQMHVRCFFNEIFDVLTKDLLSEPLELSCQGGTHQQYLGLLLGIRRGIPLPLEDRPAEVAQVLLIPTVD
jgi:hypothetical protein